MILKTFADAVSYILTYIPQTSDTTFPGLLGWQRTQNIMERLGNPQDKVKVIHVAGTSGKGSTCTLISTILQSQGATVGLNLSPHIIDIRERIQINGSLVSQDEFVQYLNSIVAVIEETRNTRYGKPTYFDVVTALAFTVFADKNVDYAVIETGLGGLLDGTNVVTRADKVAVITKIGLDHMAILGNTEEKIAQQKAGIIQYKNPVFTTTQRNEVLSVFQNEVAKKQTVLSISQHPQTVQNTQEGIVFDYKGIQWNIHNLEVGLFGDFQAENASLALQVCEFISQRDSLPFNEASLRRKLQMIRFPGRFEEKTISSKTVILDGAHNPQKMNAFVTGIQHRYPGKKFHILLACKSGKDIEEIVPILLPVSEHIILTTFSNNGNDLIHTSTTPQDLAAVLKKHDFNSYEIIVDLKTAIQKVLSDEHEYIITGSLYLIGEAAPLIQSDN